MAILKRHRKRFFPGAPVSSRWKVSHGGALVSTGMLEAGVAGRGAAGLVKSGNKVIANNDYDYAYAA